MGDGDAARRGPRRDDRAADIAAGLRALRKAAGYPTFGELAAGSGVSARELAEAARGWRVARWEVVEVFVAGCGGDVGEWRRRFADLAEEARREPEPSGGPDPVRPEPGRTARREAVREHADLRRVWVRRPATRPRPGRNPRRAWPRASASRGAPARSGLAAQSPLAVLVTLLVLGFAAVGVVSALQRSGAFVTGPASGDALPRTASPGTASPGAAATTAAVRAPAGLIKRSDSPEVSVSTTAARVPYRSWADLVAGYGPNPVIQVVPDRVYDALPTTLAPGTLVKEAGRPGIAEVGPAGTAVLFATWSDLVARRGPAPAFVTVPAYYFDRLVQG